ncbi:MAG: efflux RND transporter permease subunit [Prolixibacteraceae bacterium]|nr:efflux RND transporter permease subunit [Prolixibacteraceae bacterium]
MKKLSEFSIKYPVTITMIVLGVILLGYLSYDKLGVDLFPDLNNPCLYIELKAGEKPPEELEEQFVDNLEALAIRQSDAVEVSSVTKVGIARITVEYAWNKDMDDAYLDLQKAITSYAQNKDDIDEINISQYDPNASSVMTLCLSSKNKSDMNDLRKVAENYIRNELIRLDGIAEVGITGAQEREVLIETNQDLLDSYGLTLSEISTKINNFNASISGGSIEEMGMKYVVKGVSLLTNIEDFENILVGYKLSNTTDTILKTPIRLKDLASVSLHNKDPENIVRLNGERCLGLSIYKETKYNTVKAVDEVNEALPNIRKAIPEYNLTMVNNQGNFIKNSIKEVENSTLLGIILAVVVLFFFLKRFGSTIIISLSIPISIIATFNLMYFGGLSLNIMTLGGLALGAGMLVDNAIVVMENIFRNHENGLSVRDSAIIGTSQVGGAITSSTLTTIVVFLPIVYLHDVSGELFKDQAWTVAFSLLSSLLVAIFFIPMLFHTIYKNKTNIESRSVQVKGYGNFLKKVLKKKWLVIILTFILMGISGLMIPFIGTEFMPKTETGEFKVTVSMPEGTRLERTSSAVSNLENMISQVVGDDIETIYTQIGPVDDESIDVMEGDNTASIEIHLKAESKLSSSEAIQKINESIGEIPGIEIGYKQGETALSSILGTEEAPLVVEISGEDIDKLESLSEDVKNRIKNLSGIYNVESTMEGGSPEVEVEVDRMRAGMYDISVSTIVSQIESQLQGKIVGQSQREGEMEDITLKLPDKTLADLNDLRIVSGGQEFQVNELANIKIDTAPKQIYRRGQTRIGQVTAQLNKDMPLDQAIKEIKTAIAPMNVPSDYKINISGEEEKREESMSSLGFALLLSIVLVYMVMASQFESLLHPFTILLTIPLAVVGSILTFFFLGRSFNIMAFIGVIMLVGIAVNDSILLIDRILQLRKDGLSRFDAIIQAGQQRIRPILMTSITTILALLPLTIGFGESASLRSPMALAVIGGMITSTLLTLIVIPCVYELFEEAKEKIGRWSFFSDSEKTI